MFNFRSPFVGDVGQGVRSIDAETDYDDVGIGVEEDSELVVLLLAR